jgi:hypothetical protein
MLYYISVFSLSRFCFERKYFVVRSSLGTNQQSGKLALSPPFFVRVVQQQ